jgi:hypothetical protein
MSGAGLRRFTAAPTAAGPAVAEERCELCGVIVHSGHGHVAQLDRRSLLCACRACYLLFSREGAGRGRLRAVPERYLTDPGRRLAPADRDDLGIPVSTAFVFVNGDLDRAIACYPSPAGATESLLEPGSWQRLRGTYPLLAAPVPDVEAIYLTDGLETFLVPIDACFALVGRVRAAWRGLDGGAEVRATLAAFADDLRGRCRPIGPGPGLNGTSRRRSEP